MTFGAAVRQLRGERTRLSIAREARGPADPRSFANYLGRIEDDDVKNPGLTVLRSIARGLGFGSLHAFFARLDQDAGDDLAVDDVDAAAVDEVIVELPPAELAEAQALAAAAGVRLSELLARGLRRWVAATKQRGALPAALAREDAVGAMIVNPRDPEEAR